MAYVTVVDTYVDITGVNTSIAVPNVVAGDWIIVSLQALYLNAASMGLTSSGGETFNNLGAAVGNTASQQNLGFRNAYIVANGSGTRTITQTGGETGGESIMHIIHLRDVAGLSGTPTLTAQDQNSIYAGTDMPIPAITTTQPDTTIFATAGLVQFQTNPDTFVDPAGMNVVFEGPDTSTFGNMGIYIQDVPSPAAIASKLVGHTAITNGGGAGGATGVFGVYGASTGPEPQTLTATGFTVTPAFGVPTWSQGTPDQTLTAVGFAVTPAFGVPALIPDQVLAPTGFTVTPAFGVPTFSYHQFLQPVGFTVTPQFGTIFTFEPEGVQLLPDVFGDTGRLKVEFAWGADLQGDPELWEWDDVTSDVRIDPPIQIHIGQNDESPVPNPAQATFNLKNSSGRYWLDGRSSLWPHVRRNTPTRISVAASGAIDFDTIFQGYTDGFTPSFEPSLNPEIFNVAVSASGVLRRIEQGFSELISPYRRAMVALDSVHAYWPFEDGKNAQQAENVFGGQPSRFTGKPKFAENDEFISSAPLLDAHRAHFTLYPDPYPYTGVNQIRWLMAIPSNGLDSGTVIMHVHFEGATLYRFDITYEVGGFGPFLGFYAYGDDGGLIQRNEVAFTLEDSRRRWSLEVTQEPNNVHVRFATVSADDDETDNTEWYNFDYPNRTTANVSGIDVNPSPTFPAEGMGFGHLTIQSEITSMYEQIGPFRAFTGEHTWVRFERLADENGFKRVTYGDGSAFTYQDEMGPQIRGTLREILESCAVTDDGIIFDGVSEGLVFATRRNIERLYTTSTPSIPLSAAQVPLEIFDDDALSQNRITVSIEDQSSATREDIASIQDIGLYDKSLTVYNRFDTVADDRAAWELHKGDSAEGRYRVPTIIIDFRANPDLAPTMLPTLPGRRIMFDGQYFTVRGYKHTISPALWVMELLCMPYVHNVAQVAQDGTDDDVWQARVETDACELVGDHSAGDATLNLSSDWTADANDYPFLVNIGGNSYVALGFGAGVMTILNGLNTDKPAGTSVSLWNNQGVLGL